MNKKIVSLSFVSALFFIGCGGGGGSSGAPSIDGGGSSGSGSLISIRGFAIDPEIEKADVSIECKGLRPFKASQKTDKTGAFVINGIPANTDLSTCTILSKGGSDGDDLDSLVLKTPYSLYNKNKDIYITPFTNLLAEHEEFDTNPQDAKNEVSKFLGLSVNDLTKNPVSEMRLVKISKKLTKVAIKKDKNNVKIGHLNINNVLKNHKNFDEYVENEVSTKLEADEFEEFESQLIGIDNSTSVKEIISSSISDNTFKKLLTLFKIKKSDSYKNKNKDQKKALRTNLRKIATAITLANSETKDGKIIYNKVSNFHIRKALNDLELIPQFKDDGDEKTEDVELVDTLLTKLNFLLDDLNSYLASKNIDILNIKNFIIYDSKTYEKVLGNNNTARKDYYIHSDVSNVAKALSLAENNISDGVNDPINSLVASALGKFGFYDEAVSHIENNIYQPSELQKGYRSLGATLLSFNRSEEASKALTKEYGFILNSMNSNSKEKISVTQKNDLSSIIRYLTNIKYFDDNEALSITGANTIINKISSYSRYYSDLSRYQDEKYPSKSAAADYQVITNLIDDLATDFITFDNDLINAKKIYESNIELSKDFPIDTSRFKAHIFHLATVAIHGSIFGLDASLSAEKIFGTKENPISLSSVNKQYKVIYNALNSNDMDSIITELNALSSSYIDDAINRGVGAALFLNNKKDELFNTYYTDKYYSSTKKDTLMQYNTQLKPTNMMPTAMAIKIKGTDADLEDYLDRLIALAENWYVVSNNSEDKKNNISDSEALNVYGKWADATNRARRYGYLAISSMYKDINKEEKAKDTISKAITKINAFTDPEKKITGLINIWDAIKEFGYLNDFDKSILLQGLEDSALNSDLDSDIKYTKQRIQAANILSINNEKEKAKLIIEKAYAVIPALIQKNLNNVKERLSYLVGIYDNSNENFENSIANGYFQAVGADKAKEIIQEAYDSVKSLGDVENTIDTETQYDYLVSIIAAYGKINDLTSLKPLIPLIKTKEENDTALKEAAEALSTYDAFSSTNIASIDFDGDGDPDFFDIETSDKGELKLDIDIDGDEIKDNTDTLPYYKKAK